MSNLAEFKSHRECFPPFKRNCGMRTTINQYDQVLPGQLVLVIATIYAQKTAQIQAIGPLL